MTRGEEFCDGRLVKETDRVDVSTATQHGLYVDGRWRWYWDGEEIDDATATLRRAAYGAGETFTDQMELLTTQAATAPADVQGIRNALLQLAESQRTLFVAPGEEETMRTAVEARGWSSFVTVASSPTCPPGRMLLANTGAMAADLRRRILSAYDIPADLAAAWLAAHDGDSP